MTQQLQYDKGALNRFFEEHGRTCLYKKGENIGRPYGGSMYVHLIKSGYVRSYTLTDRGEENTHVVYKDGELFPLLWITGGPHYEVYDTALTDCVIIQVPKDELQAAIERDAELGRAVLAHAIERTRLYVARVNNLEHKYARERLVCRLLMMAGRFGQRQPDGSYAILPPITQHILASSLNLARESVSREMERLQNLGMIAYEGQRLVLLKPAELSKEFGEEDHPDWWGVPEAGPEY